MQEEFRPIDFTEGRYSISNFGRVRNNRTGGAFLPSRSGDSYRRFSWRRKKYRVHRLVANAFLDNPRNLPNVRHLDSSAAGKLNNHVSNLKFASPRESALQRKHVIIQTPQGYVCKIWVRGVRVTLKAYPTREIAIKEIEKFKWLFSV